MTIIIKAVDILKYIKAFLAFCVYFLAFHGISWNFMAFHGILFINWHFEAFSQHQVAIKTLFVILLHCSIYIFVLLRKKVELICLKHQCQKI